MRRGSSILVVIVLLAGIIAPVALATPAAVPACCRVGGNHHCEMSLKSAGLAGLSSVPESCPYRDNIAVASESAALIATGHWISNSTRGNEAAHSSPIVLSDTSSDDAHKRGPPLAQKSNLHSV
jgi:hypothetical protein